MPFCVDAPCSCHAMAVGRRDLLRFATAGAVLAALPSAAAAAGKADIFLLSCMDYRLVDDVARYMAKRGYDNKYDHVILAGASLAAVTGKFPPWNETFWQHLGVAIELHGVSKLIVVNHRDCGAFKVVFGKDFAADPVDETRIHAETMKAFDRTVGEKHPALSREYYLMALTGKVQRISVQT
jgi:carbonic anhydrase